MKLQNKKTLKVVDAEIKSAFYENTVKIKLIDKVTGTIIGLYTSLAELNEYWQDYEGPKMYWYISDTGEIKHDTDDNDRIDKYSKQIGNYFETKEEAEKAVMKLDAWARLKKKITAIDQAPIDATGTATLFVRYERKDHDEVQDLLAFLFGDK